MNTKYLIEQLEKLSGKKVVLRENKQFSLLYHSTDISNAINILKSGEIKTYENILRNNNQNPEDWYDDPNYGKFVYVSDFPHNENNYYGLSDLGVTFVIDSNKINHKMHQADRSYEGGTISIEGNIPLNAIKEVILFKKNETLIKLLQDKSIKYFEKYSNKTLQEKQMVGPKGRPKRFHLTPKNHITISKPQALIDKCIQAGIKKDLDGVSLCELTIKEKGEEKKYYRVFTHRAGCPWYDSPESISIEHIKFIASTG